MKRLLRLSLLVAFATSAHAEGLKITWLGHATFEIVSPGGTKVLVDPFLSQNPKAPADRKDPAKHKPDVVLVTHSHFDHSADVEAVAQASGAKVIGVHAWLQGLKIPDAQKAGGNVGGVVEVKDVKVHFVPAMHGSVPSGRPLGFVLESGPHRVYHTGDTWIFGDMALIAEIHRPTVLLLQAGGGPYNQSPDVAALAVKKYFSGAKTIIPMHYGTWPILAQEADVKKAFAGDARVKVMTPGQSLTL